MSIHTPTIDTSSQFAEFITAITLDGNPTDRIDSAIKGVTAAACAALDLDSDDVIVQGSYANGTAVEPVEGGYDVDLVLPCIDLSTGADAALEQVEQAFLDNGIYKDKVEAKTRCIRLNYVDDDIGEFHVDLVPARSAPTSSQAPLAVPHKGHGWNETAPVEYTKWCKDHGPHFANTVMILKRWRDEHQGVRSAIKSITLQILISQHLADSDDEGERLALTLRSMANDLFWRSTPPPLPNPVLATEDLSARWTEAAFEDFKTKIGEAADLAEAAFQADDLATACDTWRQLLGSDFPEAPASEHGIELASMSHAQTYANEGWTETPAPVKFRIHGHYQRVGQRKFRPRKYNGQTLTAHKMRLRFRTTDALPDGSIIKWQVVNTGRHARDEDSLRGEFIDSKKRITGTSAPGSKTTWEDTAYTGVHRIRAVAIRDGLVVAESNWLDVVIREETTAFAP